MWGIVAALVFFNGYQLYGIFSGSSAIVKSVSTKQELDTNFTPIQINILNGCGVAGVSNIMTKFCRELGYDVVEIGNYKSFNVEQTMVVDRSGKLESAKQLARQLGISSKNVVVQFSNDHIVTASIIIGKDYKKLNPWLN